MITMRRLAGLAALLTLIAGTTSPCAAGTVTWNFVDAAGPIDATLTINAPPVDLTPGTPWLANPADIVGFTILNPDVGPVGSYDIGLAGVVTGVGPDLTGTSIGGMDSFDDMLFTYVAASPATSSVFGESGFGFGQWVLAPNVATPEPSSLALAGIASLAGIAYGWRRRRAAAA